MATYVPARLNIGLGAEREGRPERRRDELDVRLRDGGEQVPCWPGPSRALAGSELRVHAMQTRRRRLPNRGGHRWPLA